MSPYSMARLQRPQKVISVLIPWRSPWLICTQSARAVDRSLMLIRAACCRWARGRPAQIPALPVMIWEGITPPSRMQIWCWAGLFQAQDSREALNLAWRRPEMRLELWRRKLRCPLKKRLPVLSALPMSTWQKQSGRSRLIGVMIRLILCWLVSVAREVFTFVPWQRRCACIRHWCPPGAVCSPPSEC